METFKFAEGLLSRYHDEKKRWMCRDATRVGEERVTKSPSGKYELRVTSHKTGANTWEYSKGRVYRDGALIAEICRNYHAFPHLFVEGHPKGDFLICGEDYQGQTVVDLVTGQRRKLMSDGSDNGWGFCWAAYRYDPATNIVIVDGCHWAAPYEFRFFDFSDPMSGWPELDFDDDFEEGCVYSDGQWPVIEAGLIRCYVTREEDDDEEEGVEPARETRTITTFRREGNQLKFVEEWVSEEEKVRRKKNQEARERYEAWEKNFKACDALYLTYKSRVQEAKTQLKVSDWESHGITHDGWCSDFKLKETRWCRRLNDSGGKGCTLDLEWAVETGPIKLVIWKNGKHSKDMFFEHSVAGMNRAFDLAISLAGGVS